MKSFPGRRNSRWRSVAREHVGSLGPRRGAWEQRDKGPGEGPDAELPALASRPLGLRLLHRVP